MTIDTMRSRLMRLAIGSCYLCHGYLAITRSVLYYSEWNFWLQDFLGSLGAAKVFLMTVGIIDILVAAAFISTTPVFVAFAWAIGWGFLTAIARLYFLSGFDGPFWSAWVHPLAECLKRTPNWVIAIIFYNQVRKSSWPPLFNHISEGSWAKIGFVGALVGSSLSYFVEYHNPAFELELVKVSMPLWFFHGVGALSLAGVFLAILNMTMRPFHRLWLISLGLGVASYVLSLGFEIAFLDWHHGFLKVAITVGESFTTLLTMALIFPNWPTRAPSSHLPIAIHKEDWKQTVMSRIGDT